MSLYRIALPCGISATLLLARAPDAFLNPQFWAEDGAIFFAQQHLAGASVIVQPYAGYLHLVPRVTAWIASLFPPSLAPTIYVFAYLAVVVWTTAIIASSDVRSAPLYASLLLAVPYSNEILATITNIQWLMAPGLLIVALAPSPMSFAWRTNRLIFVATAALTGPFALLASPFYLMRYARFRDSHSAALLAIVVLASLANGYLYFKFSSPPDPLHPSAVDFLMNGVHRWLALLPIGTFATDSLQTFAVLLFVAAVVCAATTPQNRQIAFSFLAFGTAVIIASALRRPEPFGFARLDWSDRYFYVPFLMMIWTLVGAIRPSRMTGIIATVALIIALNPVKLGTLSAYSRDRFEDLQWKSWASQIGTKPLEIPIHPRPWSVNIK